MVRSELIIPKVWRSELKSVALFLVFSVISVMLSNQFPGSVMRASVFSIGSKTVFMSLPIWCLLPLISLALTIIRMYDVKYSVDKRGIEAKVGRLSFHQRITRVRYEDIRSMDTNQSVTDRILDIGQVEISTAATGTVEIVLKGIAVPNDVKKMLEKERDKRQKNMLNSSKVNHNVYKAQVNE